MRPRVPGYFRRARRASPGIGPATPAGRAPVSPASQLRRPPDILNARPDTPLARPATSSVALTGVTKPPETIARGPGPRWLRYGLLLPVLVYYSALICHHSPETRWLRPPAFFSQATCLFPRS